MSTKEYEYIGDQPDNTPVFQGSEDRQFAVKWIATDLSYRVLEGRGENIIQYAALYEDDECIAAIDPSNQSRCQEYGLRLFEDVMGEPEDVRSDLLAAVIDAMVTER